MRNAKNLLATMADDTNYGKKAQNFFKLVGEQGIRADILLTDGNVSLIVRKRDDLQRKEYNSLSSFTTDEVLLFASWLNGLAGQPCE